MMKWSRSLVFLPVLFVLPLVASSGHAETDDEGDIMDSLRRKTPSGQYIDPASFFRFHGYISLSYMHADDALGSGGTPNILVSGPGPNALTGKNEGGFRNDAALFVGGEPFEGVGGVMEIHFVGDASDPVLTEAKMTWDVLSADDGDLTLRFAGGRFWWPFGIHNGAWFSAINNFSLLSPTATEVVPAHYNEVGVMAEGEFKVNDGLGLNYVAAIGNGVPGFGLMDNIQGTGADTNSNRTITGRVGLLLRNAGDIEVGLSAASGELRSVGDVDMAGTAEGYEGEFSAFGPDLTLSWQALSLRSYYYSSSEDLKGVAAGENDSISRSGYTVTVHRKTY